MTGKHFITDLDSYKTNIYLLDGNSMNEPGLKVHVTPYMFW